MPYFMTEDAVHIYYKTNGNKQGTPVVALHGWNSCHSMYDNLFSGLEDYYCIAPDFRGVNKSSLPKGGFSMECLARDTQALLDHLGLDKVLMIGYSMGASVLYKYVDLFGTGRLLKAIICDMPPKLLNDAEWREGLGQGENNPMDDLGAIDDMLTDFPAWHTKYVLERTPEIKAFPQSTQDSLLRGMRALNTDYVTVAFYASYLIQDYRPMLHKFDIPTGIFFGDPGSIYQPKTAHYIASQMSGPTKVVLFENATHLFGIEYPEKFIQETQTFFDE